MAGVRYTAFGRKRAGVRLVWGVLRMEGRKQKFRTVGEGKAAQQKAAKPPGAGAMDAGGQ